MKGLSKTAKESKKGTRIYYDIPTDTINTIGKGYYVTTLLRPNTVQELKQTIDRWKWL